MAIGRSPEYIQTKSELDIFKKKKYLESKMEIARVGSQLEVGRCIGGAAAVEGLKVTMESVPLPLWLNAP